MYFWDGKDFNKSFYFLGNEPYIECDELLPSLIIPIYKLMK